MVNLSPKFSVILPTHNRADVIGFAINSVLAQSETDFELLIIGDGCTDNTAKVVASFSDPRIKWFDFAKGPGFGYVHRNTVFKKAAGELIAFMAHDDLWFCDHLEKLGAYFKDQKVDLVYSRPIWVNPKGMIMPSSFNLDHPKMFNHFTKIANAIPASCFVHRSSCFKSVGYWNDKLPEAADWDMYKRIIASKKEKNWAFEPMPTTLHFKANWRANNPNWTHEVLFKTAQRQHSAAKNLRYIAPKGEAEQSVVWQSMKSNPKQWTKQTRASCLALADYLNQYEVINLQTNQKILAKDNQALKKENQLLKSNLQKIQLELKNLYAKFDELHQKYNHPFVIQFRRGTYYVVKSGGKLQSSFKKVKNLSKK